MIGYNVSQSYPTNTVGSAIQAFSSPDSGHGDALIAVLQTLNGAVARTQHDKNQDTVSVFDFMTPIQVADVMANTFTQDCTAAIQAAINAASTLGKKLWIPAGLYKIIPATSQTDEFATTTTAFVIKSGMHIEAEEGAIFKIANNQSTDASPKQLYMFSSVTALSNLSWRGLTMDMNGANNTLSPARPAAYNNYNFSQINFSGVNGRANDVVIERCDFINTPGTNCVVAGVSSTNGTILGQRWTISKCLFRNNGTDCNDHSSLYLWIDTVLIEGNTFTNDTQQGTVGLTGGYAAWEVHGSGQRFVGNLVNNYNRGFYLAGNITETAKNIVVTGNTFTSIKYCIVQFFREAANAFPITNVLITNNTAELTDDVTGNNLKAFVYLPCAYAITDVTVRGNRLTKPGTVVGSAFAVITSGNAGQLHTRVVFDGNDVYDATFGLTLTTSATQGLGSIRWSNNTLTDLTPAGVYGTAIGISGTGINAAGPVTHLSVVGNTTIDTRGATFTATTSGTALTVASVTGLVTAGQPYFVGGVSQGCYIASGAGTSWVLSGVPSGGNVISQPASSGTGIAQCQYGVWLQGAITNLHMTGNQYSGMTVSEFNNAATIAKATGVYFATYTPSATALTVVNGTGAVTLTGEYQQVEKLVHYRIVIAPSGTATHASTASATFISLPVTAASWDVCSAVDSGTISGYVSGYSDTTRAFTPSWIANNHLIVVSGTVRLP
jgi:hypothetical protein